MRSQGKKDCQGGLLRRTKLTSTQNKQLQGTHINERALCDPLDDDEGSEEGDDKEKRDNDPLSSANSSVSDGELRIGDIVMVSDLRSEKAPLLNFAVGTVKALRMGSNRDRVGVHIKGTDYAFLLLTLSKIQEPVELSDD